MRNPVFRVILALLFYTSVLSPASAYDTPAQVYEKVHKAIQNRNFDELVKYTSKAATKELMETPEKDRAQAMSFVAMMTPKEYRVVNVKIDGKKAVLTLEGEMSFFGSKPQLSQGIISMVKEGEIGKGQWKHDKEEWTVKETK